MHDDLNQSDGKKHDITNVPDFGACSIDCKSTVGKAPWGVVRFSGVHLPGIDIFQDEGIGLRVFSRSRQHIANDPSQDFVIPIQLQGQAQIRQTGTDADFGAGDCNVLSIAKPFSGTLYGADRRGPFSNLTARVSGAVLRDAVPNIDDYSNLAFKLRRGSGNMMKSLFEMALAEGSALPAPQAQELGKIVVRAIANAITEAPELSLMQARIPQSSPARIREIAKDFIALNLSNSLLDCDLVAKHCQVSDRYLRKAFALESTSVHAYIVGLRMEQCRAALQNPVLCHRSILEIAMSWGFDDPASFSRAYKARYGRTPREDRGVVFSYH